MPDPIDVPPGAGRAGIASARRTGRLVLLCVLLVLVAAAFGWVLGTDQGRRLLDRDHLRQVGTAARGWVGGHPVSFALSFLGAYVACAVLLLPVWWLQLLAGLTLGIEFGIGTVMAASTAGALATAGLAQWLGEDWVRERVLSRRPARGGGGRGGRPPRPGMMERALSLVGRNGLLVVLICRLSYPVPYGVSNYLFGLAGVRLRDIAVGTAVGGAPVYAGWVAAGARPEWLGRWEFWATVVGGNLVILGTLLAATRRTRKDGTTKSE